MWKDWFDTVLVAFAADDKTTLTDDTAADAHNTP